MATIKDRKLESVKAMLNYLLIVSIFVMSILLVSKLNIAIESRKYHSFNKVTKREKIYFKHIISKINFIKTKENFLSKQGNPMKLTATKYYILKIIFSVSFFMMSLYNYGNIIVSIAFSAMAYFSLDMYIKIIQTKRKNEICKDLLNITESLYLQLSAHMPLKDALKKQYNNCKNKDFKKAMISFIAQYEFSELNMEKALYELKEKFDIQELDMFCNTIIQCNATDDILELLKNLSDSLLEKYINTLKNNTTSKVLTITFGVIIALGNIVLITFYPLFISIGQGFNTIFK